MCKVDTADKDGGSPRKLSSCISVICFIHVMFLRLSRVRTEMGEETQKTVEKIETIEKQSKPLYYAEPSQEAPRIPPNPELSQKAGYLYMRR